MRLRGTHRPSSDATHDDAEVARLRRRYLDLMKGALTHTLYRPLDVRFENAGYVVGEEMRESVEKEFSKKDFDWADVRADGRDWPRFAQSMIGLKRLDNIEQCVVQVLEDGVPGDLIETGVWRGGAVIFMRGILKAYGVQDRMVWVADSFQGLPPNDPVKYPKETPIDLHQHGELAISLEQVQRNFASYGLLDGQVKFLKGWFRDTLPSAPIRTLSILRLDGDLYESTMDALTLYPKLSPGGFVIVDDYNTVKACNDAIEDFRKERGISDALQLIEGGGGFWRKS
jgi:O-methyltransferase